MRLVLASGSPRRRELLAQLGYEFDVQAADVDETLRADEEPAAYVLRLSEDKARAVFSRLSTGGPGDQLTVLGADTCVVCDGAILGKPVGRADAVRMLRRLRGRQHRVLTGVAVATRAEVRVAVETTVVTFAAMGDEEIARYVASGEPMDKAGAYGIQGYWARWVPRIEGCYFNVMGLPLARTAAMIDASRNDLSGQVSS